MVNVYKLNETTLLEGFRDRGNASPVCEVVLNADYKNSLARIARLEAALRELQRLGEEGMQPDYRKWQTFHDKVAEVARTALSAKHEPWCLTRPDPFDERELKGPCNCGATPPSGGDGT